MFSGSRFLGLHYFDIIVVLVEQVVIVITLCANLIVLDACNSDLNTLLQEERERVLGVLIENELDSSLIAFLHFQLSKVKQVCETTPCIEETDFLRNGTTCTFREIGVYDGFRIYIGIDIGGGSITSFLERRLRVSVGIGADGTATTDPTVRQLTTASPETNTFTVVQGLTGHSDASYSVVPAHSESYVALFERSCYLKDNSGNYLSDDQIIDAILASRGGTIASSVYSGNATIYECPLVPDEDYCLLVFGYFAGGVTSGLTKAEFHTKAASPDTQQSFSIMSSSLQTNSFEVSYSPYYENRPFMANYMPMSDFIRLNGDLSDKASTNAAIRQYNDQVVEELYNNWSLKDYADKKEYLHRRLNTAYVSYKIEDLKASSDYLCYAIGMTADGTYTTDASVLKVSTKTVYNTPQISEILPYFSGSWLTLWFYINQDAPAKLYGCSSLVNDRSMYDLSDDEIRNYFYEGYDWDKGTQSPKRMWAASEYFQSSAGNVQSGDVVYSAGILVGEDKDTYTVFRDAYEVK